MSIQATKCTDDHLPLWKTWGDVHRAVNKEKYYRFKAKTERLRESALALRRYETESAITSFNREATAFGLIMSLS